jgi:hypothetical protein
MRKSRPKSLKAIPSFRSEEAEREFWATADSTEYFDWSTARRAVFPNLKPSTATISLRSPQRSRTRLLRALAKVPDVASEPPDQLPVLSRPRKAVARGARPKV